VLGLPSVYPYSIQPLGESSFFLERLGLRGQLPVEKMATQIQQGQRGIGYKLR